MWCPLSVSRQIHFRSKRRTLALVLILAFAWWLAVAQFASAQTSAEREVQQTLQWRFATVEEGQALLSKTDEFIQRLSPFDRSARLKTSKVVSKEEHLEFISHCVRPWKAKDREKLQPVLEQVRERLQQLPLPLPEEILLIKTNGKEEGQAPYTRGNAIVLPADRLGAESPQSLKSLLFHELFHIASRADHVLRDKLYEVIGFENCGELAFPVSLASRKITNPDAPVLQHCIEVTIDGMKQWVVPVLYANAEKYNEKRGGEFFQYLTFELLVVQRDPTTGKLSENQEGSPILASPRKAKGFMEKIGTNTRYIIHPEEILADNFALLASQDGEIRTPGIIDRMEATLKSHRR